MALDKPSNPETVVQSWGSGHIKIVRRYDAAEDREIEIVDVLGVRVQRRDSQNGLPVSTATPEMFNDMTFTEPEIKFLQAILHRYTIGHHGLFLGPPGLGKSRMTELMAYLLNVPFYREQCVKDMKVQKKFLFTMVPQPDGSWKGRLGPLPKSMIEGGILLVDELPNLEPTERQILLEPTERPNEAVFGNAPTLHISDFPGGEAVIQAQRGWFMLATGNYAEGQGAGEIHPLSDREERRIRPHMLGALPPDVRPGRALGRHFPGTKDKNTNLNVPRTEYYERGEAILTQEAAEVVMKLFSEFESIVRAEILKNVKQDPPVYLTEALERAFDHFIFFQVKAGATGADPVENRTAEIIKSAELALEFYFSNSFREDTKMKVPDTFQTTFQANTGKMDQNGRTSVREYITWRMARVREALVFDVGGVTKNFSERLKLSVKSGVLLQEVIGKVRKIVDDQYPYADQLVSKFGLNDAPNAEKVKAVLNNLSEAELQLIMEMKEPKLLIQPDLPPAEYRKIFDSQFPNKRAKKDEVDAAWGAKPMPSPVTYKVIIIEGAGKLDPTQGDDIGKTLQERLQNKTGSILEMESYYLLTMRTLQDGKAIDKDTQTIINGVQTGERVAMGKQTTWMDIQMARKANPAPTAFFRNSVQRKIS